MSCIFSNMLYTCRYTNGCLVCHYIHVQWTIRKRFTNSYFKFNMQNDYDTAQVRTCPDIWIFMAYASVWFYPIIGIKIRTKSIFVNFGLWAHEIFVQCVRGVQNSGVWGLARWWSCCVIVVITYFVGILNHMKYYVPDIIGVLFVWEHFRTRQKFYLLGIAHYTGHNLCLSINSIFCSMTNIMLEQMVD